MGRVPSEVRARHAGQLVARESAPSPQPHELSFSRAEVQDRELEAQHKLASELAELAAAGEVEMVGDSCATPVAEKPASLHDAAVSSIRADTDGTPQLMPPPPNRSPPNVWRQPGRETPSAMHLRTSVSMAPGTEQKAIDARWKELNLKIREHDAEAARVASKSEKLEQRSLQLAKRER